MHICCRPASQCLCVFYAQALQWAHPLSMLHNSQFCSAGMNHASIWCMSLAGCGTAMIGCEMGGARIMSQFGVCRLHSARAAGRNKPCGLVAGGSHHLRQEGHPVPGRSRPHQRQVHHRHPPRAGLPCMQSMPSILWCTSSPLTGRMLLACLILCLHVRCCPCVMWVTAALRSRSWRMQIALHAAHQPVWQPRYSVS